MDPPLGPEVEARRAKLSLVEAMLGHVEVKLEENEPKLSLSWDTWNIFGTF